MAGTRLRFFSSRVFGVWVEGVIKKVGSKYVHIDAYHLGNQWTERVGKETEVYRPSGHPQAGESFKLA